MILKEFPDLSWLRSQAESGFAERKSWTGGILATKGWPNVILNAKSGATVRDNIKGPLSLFTNISGESTVEVSRRRIAVKEGFFFLTNHDQHYTLEVPKGTQTETFNIHFGEYFCDQVFDSLAQAPDKLLDNNFQVPSHRLEFCNKLYRRDDVTLRAITDIRNNTSAGSDWLEQKLYVLVENLLKNEKELRKIQSRFPGLKTSTREEIFKRILIVSDYIQSNLDKELSLDELAGIGCISKFHFLRLFKIAFNKTPYQFINEERVHRAIHQIRQSRISIREISRSLGFKNASSFSRMFFQQTGFYPTQLR